QRAGRRLAPGDDALGVRAALLYIGLVFLSGALLQKFDLVIGTLCLTAVLALAAERHELAGAALALAALVKGFPALALPVCAAYVIARAARGMSLPDLRAALRAQARPLGRLVGVFAGGLAGRRLLGVGAAGLWGVVAPPT